MHKIRKIIFIASLAVAGLCPISHAMPTGEVLDETQQGVTDIEYSADNKLASACYGDGALKLWNVETDEAVLELPPYKGEHVVAVNDMAFAPNGKFMVRNLSHGQPISAHENAIHQELASEISVWSLETKQLISTSTSTRAFPEHIAVLPDNETLVAFCNDLVVRFWDIPKRKWRKSLPDHRTPNSDKANPDQPLAFAASGWTVAYQGRKAIVVWHQGKVQRLITKGLEDAPIKDTKVEALAISADGKVLAAVINGLSTKKVPEYEEMSRVVLWDARSGKLIRILPSQIYYAYHLALSPAGQTVFVSGSNLQAWDVASQKKLGQWKQEGDRENVGQMRFSSEGKNLLVTRGRAIDEGRVEIWNLQDVLKK